MTTTINRVFLIRRGIHVTAALLLIAISTVTHADGLTFVHTDHLGTPVAYTNAAGEVIGREQVTPYGESLNPPTGNDQPAFTGHTRDGATGLVYMQARYYDPVTGRMLSADPVDFAGGGVDHFGRYHYANNNPTNLIDPTGAVFADPRDCDNDPNCKSMGGGSAATRSASTGGDGGGSNKVSFVGNDSSASSLGPASEDSAKELLATLSRTELDALAKAVAAIDGLLSAADRAIAIDQFVQSLDARQTVLFGNALGLGMVAADTPGSLNLNRAMIYPVIRRITILDSLPLAREAGRNATSAIYVGPVQSAIFKTFLPAKMVEAADTAHLAWSFREIYGTEGKK